MAKSLSRFGGDSVVKSEAPMSAVTRPCAAFGCPELGSISHSNAGPAPAESWFCRWHVGAAATEWPEITRRRRLARDSEPPADVDPKRQVTAAEAEKIRAQVRGSIRRFGRGPADALAWARKLRSREAAGDHLSDPQRDGWRKALRFDTGPDAGESEAEREARIEREAIQAEHE